MLFNPQWTVETKPDVFSLESLIGWLEKQPPKISYDYTDPWDCLLCRYFKAMGFKDVALDMRGLDHSRAKGVPYPAIFIEISHCPDEETYGAALTRARKLQSA